MKKPHERSKSVNKQHIDTSSKSYYDNSRNYNEMNKASSVKHKKSQIEHKLDQLAATSNERLSKLMKEDQSVFL